MSEKEWNEWNPGKPEDAVHIDTWYQAESKKHNRHSKQPIKVQKKQRPQFNEQIAAHKQAHTLRKDSEDSRPVTLSTAKTADEVSQAWRSVRTYYGMEIFMDLDIGTPGQSLRVLLDSGSDWFWVTADGCLECGGIKKYSGKTSSTYQLLEKDAVAVEYGSGLLSGDWLRETVCLSTARACQGNFCTQTCVEDLSMIGVTYQDEGLQSLVSDGLLGLAPVKIGDHRAELFIDKALEQGQIDARVFSLAFAGDYDESYITFGGYDADQFAVEDITWFNNTGEYFWAVQLDQVSFGDENIALYSGLSSWKVPDCVVDSGSSYILMPETQFNQLKSSLEETLGLDCDVDYYHTLTCYLSQESDYDLLPELTFTFEGKEYRVPRTSLYLLDNQDSFWYYPSVTVEVTYITGWNEWILGLTFLENYYVVYDAENNNVGFALSKMSSMAKTGDVALLGESVAPNTDLTQVIGGCAAITALAVGVTYVARRFCSKSKSADDSYRRAE